MVRGLMSTLTAHSNSCAFLTGAGAGAPRGAAFSRRASLCSIRVQELVQRSDGGLRPRRNFGGFRSSSGKFDALSVGVSKMKKGSVECSGSSSQAESSSPETVPKVFRPVVSFCQTCGGAMEQRIPEGEHEMRAVCSKCGSIHYQNPKMVVGCLVEHENKVLLCRRSIEPSYGLWTLPAGYMELGESAAEGAARETLEEAQAHVEVVGHFAHLDIPLIGQSYIIFRARLKDGTFSPGPESLECALFSLDEIPFDSIAFSSITVALKMYIEDVKAGRIKHHHGVIVKRPGASPSDPTGYFVRDHLAV